MDASEHLALEGERCSDTLVAVGKFSFLTALVFLGDLWDLGGWSLARGDHPLLVIQDSQTCAGFLEGRCT